MNASASCQGMPPKWPAVLHGRLRAIMPWRWTYAKEHGSREACLHMVLHPYAELALQAEAVPHSFVRSVAQGPGTGSG